MITLYNMLSQKCFFCWWFNSIFDIMHIFSLIAAKMYTLPSWIDVTSRQLISTHNSVISATKFIKNGSSLAVTCLFQAPHLLKSRNQWTFCSSFMPKTWFYSLAPFFKFFFCFLMRNFNSFSSYFYYCNWPENSCLFQAPC